MDFEAVLPWAGLSLALVVFAYVDIKALDRGDEEPSLRASAIWSVVWLVVGLGASLVVWAVAGPTDAGLYVGVYLVERTLSLDNVFVFLAIFSFFDIATRERTRVLTWAIVGALGLRIVAILLGVALVKRFEILLVILGALLVVLAWRLYTGKRGQVQPGDNPAVKFLRRWFPVTQSHAGGHFSKKIDGKRHITPLALCLGGAIVADIIFAIDSIPTAFAITRDSFLIVMGNAFALLGLRALFSLSEALIARLRYLDRTIAILLGVIGVKLMTEDVLHIGPAASVAGIAAILATGIIASVVAERRAPSRGQAAPS
jgi:tellurite resistance protein TerC